MSTTPTNEAGHGLPELPEPYKKGRREIPGVGKFDIDCGAGPDLYTAAQVHQYAIDYAASLALSRGVPADMVVMPREATPAIVDAWTVCNGGPAECYRAMVKAAPEHPSTVTHAPLYDSFDEWYEHYDGEGGPKNVEQLARDAWFGAQRQTTTNPAPAAAGAQGEDVAWTHDAETWGNALNEAAWTFVEECPEKSALLFNNAKGPLRAAILKYAELVGATTPQPAAADGGVRERAIAILAKVCCVKESSIAEHSDSDVSVELALRAISAALSSHRQAGDVVASICLVTERRLPHFASVEVQLYDGYEPKIGDKLYTTPAPSADAVRELAKHIMNWQPLTSTNKADRLYQILMDAGLSFESVTDELLALVEKGAGNG